MHKPLYIIAACCTISFTSLAQSQGNEVFIQQLDGSNQASVEQGAGPGQVINSLADIYQKGNSNEVAIFQGRNSLGSQGEGTVEDNTASVRQIGADNSFKIEQVSQGGLLQNNVAEVLQRGNGNQGYITQEVYYQDVSRNNTARLTQEGDDNEASISQGDNGVLGSTATLIQKGNSNDGQIDQGSAGSSDNTTATLVQQGDNNRANILHGGYASDGTNSTGTITQQGDGNDAEIRQGVFGYAESSTGTITQRGDGHKARVSQGESSLAGGTYAENAIGTIAQQGESNEAAIFQGTDFVFVQNADGTSTDVYFDGAEAAIGSEAAIDQRGDNHYAVTLQAGTGDMIDVQQRGSSSYAIVGQGIAIPR